MTMLEQLQQADMLLVDGLHAWQFELGEQGLLIECIDGRERRVWRFTLEQIQAAKAAQAADAWLVVGEAGEHEVVCLGAISATNDEEDEQPLNDN